VKEIKGDTKNSFYEAIELGTYFKCASNVYLMSVYLRDSEDSLDCMSTKNQL
jgi:hypothetical protein